MALIIALVVGALLLVRIGLNMIRIEPVCQQCESKSVKMVECQLTGDAWIDWQCETCSYRWRDE